MAENKRYRCLVGINYAPGNRRAEAGDVIDDLNPAQVAALGPALEETPDPLFRVSRGIPGLDGPTALPPDHPIFAPPAVVEPEPAPEPAPTATEV